MFAFKELKPVLPAIKLKIVDFGANLNKPEPQPSKIGHSYIWGISTLDKLYKKLEELEYFGFLKVKGNEIRKDYITEEMLAKDNLSKHIEKEVSSINSSSDKGKFTRRCCAEMLISILSADFVKGLDSKNSIRRVCRDIAAFGALKTEEFEGYSIDSNWMIDLISEVIKYDPDKKNLKDQLDKFVNNPPITPFSKAA